MGQCLRGAPLNEWEPLCRCKTPHYVTGKYGTIATEIWIFGKLKCKKFGFF